MVINEPPAQSPVSTADQAAPADAFDADFDNRWAAWVAKGHAHEQRVRRKLIICGGVVAVGTAFVYAFLR